MAEADLLEKAEALLRLARSRGFGLVEYSEGPLQLRVAFAAASPDLASAPPSRVGLPGIAEGDAKPETASHPAPATAFQAVILSPGVGFLRRSHPAGGTFPGEGNDVAAGTVVALIQAGPLLQPVAAPRPGRLGRMLLAEGAGVGFGTALFEFS